MTRRALIGTLTGLGLFALAFGSDHNSFLASAGTGLLLGTVAYGVIYIAERATR